MYSKRDRDKNGLLCGISHDLMKNAQQQKLKETYNKVYEFMCACVLFWHNMYLFFLKIYFYIFFF